MSRYWAFLADPKSYGWDDLTREGRAVWDGIGNAVAQRNLREVSTGDEVMVYHTAPDKAVVGIARVVSDAYPDPSNDKRVVVDIEPVRPLERPVSLAELKADELLANMGFVRMPRVAVQPVSADEWKRMAKMERDG